VYEQCRSCVERARVAVQVKLVGKVMHVERRLHDALIFFDDGTGIARLRQWLVNEDNTGNVVRPQPDAQQTYASTKSRLSNGFNGFNFAVHHSAALIRCVSGAAGAFDQIRLCTGCCVLWRFIHDTGG